MAATEVEVRILLDAIKQLSESNGPRFVDKEIADAAAQLRDRSQGLVVSPAVRKAIEDLAMERATGFLAQRGTISS